MPLFKIHAVKATTWLVEAEDAERARQQIEWRLGKTPAGAHVSRNIMSIEGELKVGEAVEVQV